MAYKQFALDERTQITIYKRKASRSLRLSISPDGKIRVSIPSWAPYRAGVEFARTRHSWIKEQLPVINLLSDGQAIGKAHHLRFVIDSSLTEPRSRINGSEIIIRHAPNDTYLSANIQAIATRACTRALRMQAGKLLPERLAILAQNHNYKYQKVSIKQLKGRWGSCDQQTNITLNLYLMLLPWDLIDYVLLHELVHTRILHHGPKFWSEMEINMPDAKLRRKRIKDFKPML